MRTWEIGTTAPVGGGALCGRKDLQRRLPGPGLGSGWRPRTSSSSDARTAAGRS